MSVKLFKDISASTLQVIINQLLAAVVFLITSFYLSKESYGELNWSLAVFAFAGNLLSLRLEQIVVRKAATHADSSGILAAFMFHVLLTGCGFYLLLLVLRLSFPGFFSIHDLLLLTGIGQLFTFFSLPFKQIANGKERFDYLAMMSSVNNLAKVILLSLLIFFSALSIESVLIIFIIGAVVEFLFCFWVARFRLGMKMKAIAFAEYVTLLRESLPQIGAAILMAGITRLDWIFLGLFSTSIITAEYSFAYRVYELSPFPLLIIAPILLSRFSKFFSNNNNRSLLEKEKHLRLLIRFEMIMATLIPLMLNLVWVPLIDSLTDNKYGLVNSQTFLILSICIPFQYISNLIWSAYFAQNRLKHILRITAVTFLVVLVGDLVLIPMYGATGAAMVYLIAMIIEYINFMRHSAISRIRESWFSLACCLLSAIVSGILGISLFDSVPGRLIFAVPVYVLLLIATRQLQVNDLQFLHQFTRYGRKSSPLLK